MKRKKVFKSCGHKGFGKYCHLCKDLEAGKLKQGEGLNKNKKPKFVQVKK